LKPNAFSFDLNLNWFYAVPLSALEGVGIMLEFWYREKRTLVDFRRGPLGPHFDSYAAKLKAAGYSRARATEHLSKACQFNAFLVDRGIAQAKELSASLLDEFTEHYHAYARHVAPNFLGAQKTRQTLMHFLRYLQEIRVYRPPKPKPVATEYSWIVDRFVRYLRRDRKLSESTIRYRMKRLNLFLAHVGPLARPKRLKTLTAAQAERLIREHFRESGLNPSTLSTVLRTFFQFCAQRRYTSADFSGLVPSVRSYRHASLPKGLEDSALEKMLKQIPRDSSIGARDYALVVTMMAYGIRGISAAELLLEDLNWRTSQIRIRAQKGGKEVVLPLSGAVGDALIAYLRVRPAHTPFREVFLSVKVPFRPLDSVSISRIVRHYLILAGVKQVGIGSRALRHSWAIRALSNDSSIKAIADVLGHRYIDTTFIYAKADLNSLREVALPWPDKE
jgi:integrase/recombinase XerD